MKKTNNDRVADIIGTICVVITVFAFYFLCTIIDIPPLLQPFFAVFTLVMCLVVGIVVRQILAREILEKGAIGEIAIMSGAAILGVLFIKALFKKDTLIY